MTAFLRRHPLTAVDLRIDARAVNLVEERIDVAIRITNDLDPNLVARRLGECASVVCASPAYLAARGCPRRLADLALHDCLIQTSLPYWDFVIDGRVLHHRMEGRLTANSIDAVQAACTAGAGIACMAAWNAAQEVVAGTLVPVELADAVVEPWGIWAITPSPRLIPPKVRLFIAALQESL